MPRASGASNPPAAAAAAAKNVSSNAGHSDPSCSVPAYQLFRPVTRSMTRVSGAIVASSDLKEEGSASTSTRKSTSDASFSIQSAASRPIVTRVRTPQKVTKSAWEPLSQPVALSEGQKCASLTTMNATAKRSRVASSRAAKDSTNHSASKANTNVPSGKKNRDEETMSQGGQLDGTIMPSPPKKLQTCKAPSDALSKRKSTIKILGGRVAAPLTTGKSTESGKKSVSVPAKVVDASINDSSQSAAAAVPLLAQQLQPDTTKNSSVFTQSSTNHTSQVNQSAATVVTLPRQNLQTDYEKKPPIVPVVTNQVNLQTDYQKKPHIVPVMTNQVSGLASATAPLVPAKLQIGKAKDTSNVLSNPASARALLIKQQEQLLQQYKLGRSQQQQEQQLHIKGPALSGNDDTPPVEPLGTRCQLCKLDVAFRPQGDAGRDASTPPVIAVLACHHAFHSSCIESVYGLAEPSLCLACVESGEAH
uniref:RING-type domain-containing protein n=1 Tax=Arundo donax TaxID=35708 RepID=A0A0A9DB10_ARUDO